MSQIPIGWLMNRGGLPYPFQANDDRRSTIFWGDVVSIAKTNIFLRWNIPNNFWWCWIGTFTNLWMVLWSLAISMVIDLCTFTSNINSFLTGIYSYLRFTMKQSVLAVITQVCLNSILLEEAGTSKTLTCSFTKRAQPRNWILSIL